MSHSTYCGVSDYATMRLFRASQLFYSSLPTTVIAATIIAHIDLLRYQSLFKSVGARSGTRLVRSKLANSSAPNYTGITRYRSQFLTRFISPTTYYLFDKQLIQSLSRCRHRWFSSANAYQRSEQAQVGRQSLSVSISVEVECVCASERASRANARCSEDFSAASTSAGRGLGELVSGVSHRKYTDSSLKLLAFSLRFAVSRRAQRDVPFRPA